LVRAAKATLDEEPQSRGLAVYVTQPQHLKLFEQNSYELVQELDVGDIRGKLLFQSRVQAQEVNRAV